MTDPFHLPLDESGAAPLPIQYASRLACHRCDVGHTLTGAQVVDVWEGEKATCRECAYLEPRLAPWQHLADAVQAMDGAFIAAGGRGNRQLFADYLARQVGYMASWRGEPGDEPIEPRS